MVTGLKNIGKKTGKEPNGEHHAYDKNKIPHLHIFSWFLSNALGTPVCSVTTGHGCLVLHVRGLQLESSVFSQHLEDAHISSSGAFHDPHSYLYITPRRGSFLSLISQQDGVLTSMQDEFAPFKEAVDEIRHVCFTVA